MLLEATHSEKFLARNITNAALGVASIRLILIKRLAFSESSVATWTDSSLSNGISVALWLTREVVMPMGLTVAGFPWLASFAYKKRFRCKGAKASLHKAAQRSFTLIQQNSERDLSSQQSPRPPVAAAI